MSFESTKLETLLRDTTSTTRKHSVTVHQLSPKKSTYTVSWCWFHELQVRNLWAIMLECIRTEEARGQSNVTTIYWNKATQTFGTTGWEFLFLNLSTKFPLEMESWTSDASSGTASLLQLGLHNILYLSIIWQLWLHDRFVKTLLLLALHSTYASSRHLAGIPCSTMYHHGCPCPQLNLEGVASWRSEFTYCRFYHWPITKSNFGQEVLRNSS